VDGTVRPALPADVPEILRMVRGLAEYEKSADQVEMTEQQPSTVRPLEQHDLPGPDRASVAHGPHPQPVAVVERGPHRAARHGDAAPRHPHRHAPPQDGPGRPE
jgi:hypothetical protein